MHPHPQRQASERSGIPGFEVMRIVGRIEELRAAGRDIVSLTAGEPGGGAPPGVNEAAARVHSAQTVLNYAPALGLRPLRESIAAHCRDWYGVDVPAERVAVTTGSSGAFVLSFLAAFDHGDRVALARPGYPAYRNILSSLGIIVEDLDCGPEARFQPTVEQLSAVHRERPLKGLVVASPANPTGTMLDRDQLSDLSRWCTENGVQLISDEIYHGISYTQPSVSALETSEDAIVVSSFSKFWGMPGWRLGWAVLPEHLTDAVERLAGNVTLSAPHGSQLAAAEAFSAESMEFCRTQAAGYAQARQHVLDALPDLGWGDLAPADGAFYVYAHLGKHLGEDPGQHRDATAYAEALLERGGVAVVPGTDFDRVNGHEWIRVSLAPGPAKVAEGLERILSFHARG